MSATPYTPPKHHVADIPRPTPTSAASKVFIGAMVLWVVVLGAMAGTGSV